MIRLYLIRHGQTPGNKLQRYIGTTDEPLSTEGKEFLEKLTLPMPEALYVSPLAAVWKLRGSFFREKAFILSKSFPSVILESLRIKIIKSFPEIRIIRGGSTAMERFLFREEKVEKRLSARSLTGFQKAVTQCIRNNIKTAALVIHGGTIMNIMEEYADRPRAFYEWHVKNGGGYLAELEPALWQKGRRELCVRESYMEG